MTTIRDKGALVAAVVALAIALGSWVSHDGGRSQQLSDLVQQVQTLEGQVQHLQGEMDQYLFRHDGGSNLQ